MRLILYLCHPAHGCHPATLDRLYEREIFHRLVKCECPEMARLLLKNPKTKPDSKICKPLKRAFRDLFKDGWRTHEDFPTGWKPKLPL